MNQTLTVTRRFRVCQKHRGRRRLSHGDRCAASAQERIPRIARLMALAIRFDQLLRDGVVADQAELARVGHVSRARLTQIMNLLDLGPDLQEQLLNLRPKHHGRNSITERQLRPIAALADWKAQRRMWHELPRDADT